MPRKKLRHSYIILHCLVRALKALPSHQNLDAFEGRHEIAVRLYYMLPVLNFHKKKKVNLLFTGYIFYRRC